MMRARGKMDCPACGKPVEAILGFDGPRAVYELSMDGVKELAVTRVHLIAMSGPCEHAADRLPACWTRPRRRSRRRLAGCRKAARG